MALGPHLTKTSERAQQFLEFALRSSEHVKGDFVECGVWAGGNLIIARKTRPELVCWAYDTFAGMTKPTAKDRKRSGVPAMASFNVKTKAGRQWNGISQDEVRQNLWDCGVLDEDKLRFIEGPVEETLLGLNNLPDAISVLRLDTDWYASTKVELEMLYPRLSPGGFLIVDDYGHWEGARAAVDEYLGKGKMEAIDYTVHFMVKP